MSAAPYPLGAAAASGLPLLSVTKRAKTAAQAGGACAQTRALPCRADGWAEAVAGRADTAAVAAATPRVTVRARRLIEPPDVGGARVSVCSLSDDQGAGKGVGLSTSCQA